MSRTLAEVIALLERIAPLDLSEDWDNTGLLLEPLGAAERPIERPFLCIDLDEVVLDEAIARSADFVIAYHPPLFRGLKRLRARSPEERVLLRALAAGLCVYSPHTALDATEGGVNDWLARAFGPGRSAPLVAAAQSSAAAELKLVVFVPSQHVAELRSALSRELGAGSIGNYSECSYELEGRGSFFGNEASAPRVGERGTLSFVSETRLEMRCPAAALKDLPRVIAAHHPYEEPAWDLYPLFTLPRANVGAGRLLELATPISIGEAVTRLKTHLELPSVRVATAGVHAAGAAITRIALCAGAGGSLFQQVPHADLFVTGEMRHHDVLARVRAGSSVILSEHTHTERGYLPEFARRLEESSEGQLRVLVSERDRDPLQIA
ncbi:MAG TPA: Nif3-like dinuclear metal center hexameric protein [Polyangiaceae bacterium]|nr:Nif3-like dinuclear metal center hexameric protein [Polyangiaceae bacterium]